MAVETLAMPHRFRTPLDPPTSPTHTRSATLSNDTSSAPVSPVATSEYQRSASYTYLPAATKEQFLGRHNIFTLKGSFSEDDLLAVPEQNVNLASAPSSGQSTPEEHATGLHTHGIAARDLALELQNNPKISVQSFSSDLEDTAQASHASSSDRIDAIRESASSVSSATSRARQRSSVSTNASRKVQRRSWYSIATTPDSRSPSPSKQDSEASIVDEETVSKGEPALPSSTTTAKRRSVLPQRESFGPIEEQDDASVENGELSRPSISRRSSIFRGKRPLSSIFARSSVDINDEVPALPSIPKSFSTDRLPTLASGSAAVHRAALPPRLGPMERINAQASFSNLRKKDELWSVFRALDADHSKFTSKSVALKANVVRSGLIPFLRLYAGHPSTFVLRAEDLDRRANILNKWWTALIEMLHGRNNQSISGTDRPVILDGIAGIMDRPEWRLYPSHFCPLDRRTKGALLPRDRSRTSLSASASSVLQDTVHQNVRNIFVQNLRAQMAFVVDKMSLRNAAASLVTFCGKACAYAFMFVPGMADVLARLWDLQADVLRRVLLENGVGRLTNLSRFSDEVLPEFPSCLHELKFTTLADFVRRLRTSPPLPTGTTNIQWWGYWLERWTGHESDLFYVFVKHYHILVADFLHPGSTREERMCVPGMLLVHGQILSNLDTTIHRQLGKAAAQEATALAALEDVLTDPDAVATTLPLPPINATRQMAENRLVMLIRDFLSERTASHPIARQLFAESFNGLLQAATRGISVYDPTACYTLLELLEEAFVILVRYEQLSDGVGSLINAEFWHLVSRRMLSSENTLIEIRLYAFLYTVWNTVVCDNVRKADLCLGLLLDPLVFASRFNHWSPMVRAYYMRLLCWRVARFDGNALPGDFEILDTLLERLQDNWSYHLWCRETAVNEQASLPQTSPCNPAPHRRMRIIRTDTFVNPVSFQDFDVIAPPMPPPPQTRQKTNRQSTLSTLSSVAELETRPQLESPDSATGTSPPNGIRGFFKTMVHVGTRSRSASQNSGTTTPPTAGGIPSPPRGGSASINFRSGRDDMDSQDSSLKSGASTPTAPPVQHRQLSFKFSFEYNVNIRQPPPLRLIPPRLPMPAQNFLAATSERVNSPLIMTAVEPRGIARKRAKYCGRALAEWALIVGECQSFFDRRRNEGVPENRLVETPALSIEIFKRPG